MSAMRGLLPARAGCLCLAALAATAAVWLLGPGRAASAPRVGAADAAPGLPVVVSVTPASSAPAVARDFLGLSFEVSDLPRIASYAKRGDLVTLLRSLGTGVMRFGGASADASAAWSAGGPAPPWALTRITAADLRALGVLAARTGWSVLLTVNLGHYDPAAAAQEAHVAALALGNRLAGIEIGNEPDAYMNMGLRARGWNYAAYRGQADAYRAAIHAAAPGVAIVGPDASSGVAQLAWLRAEAAGAHPPLLTDHYYPTSSCGYTPQLSDLLSPRLRLGETSMLTRLASISRSTGIPVRLDETNSISCSGEPGVSNAFASTLWALDYVTRAMALGLSGLDLHDLIGKPFAYSPLVAENAGALADGELHANPEWYALLVARELVGDRPLPSTVRAGDGELSAFALRSPKGALAIVLVDFDEPGAQALSVRLHVPSGYRAGTVLRITAPSPAALDGVKLDGIGVDRRGGFSPPSGLPALSGGPRSLTLSMAPASAALVTLAR
jgi:hypothetical protein